MNSDPLEVVNAMLAHYAELEGANDQQRALVAFFVSVLARQPKSARDKLYVRVEAILEMMPDSIKYGGQPS